MVFDFMFAISSPPVEMLISLIPVLGSFTIACMDLLNLLPAKVQAALKRSDNPDTWNQWCKILLFQGCITGKRIKAVFGDLVDDMIFDQSTKEILNNPREVPKADLKHMRNTILRIRPDTIITFGNHTTKALHKIITSPDMWYHIRIPKIIFNAPHPAARQPDTIAKLKSVAEKLRVFKENYVAEK